MRVIYPMCADAGKLTEAWESDQFIAEEKFDGSRYLTHIENGVIRLTSRQKSVKTGLPVEKTGNVPHIALDATLLGFNGTVLDGEMRHSDFSQTISIMGSAPEKAIAKQQQVGNIDYHVFDILFVDGRDVTGLKLMERKEILNRVLEDVRNPHIKFVKMIEKDKEEYFLSLVAQGGEGVILKDKDSLYYPGARSKSWLKAKRYMTDDVVIIGATDPVREYEGGHPASWEYKEGVELVSRAWAKGWIGAIRFGKFRNGKIVVLGQTAGMDDEVKMLISDGKHCIKSEFVGKVMEIGAMEIIQKTNAYRHPRFLRFRPDKNMLDCQL